MDRRVVTTASSSVSEIAERTWRLESVLGSRNVFQYLIGSEVGEVLLVDTGTSETPRETLLPALRYLGLSPEQLALVVVTHPDVDHQGGIAALAELCPHAVLCCGFYDRAMIAHPEKLLEDRYQCYLAEHKLGYSESDVRWIRAFYGAPTELGATFSGGEVVGVGERILEVHHAPGHSAGHLILFERASGLMFSSDAIHFDGCPGTDGGRAMCPTYEEVDDYLTSVSKVAALDPSEIHSGHWPIRTRAEIPEWLTLSRQFVSDVDDVLLDRLTEPATMLQLCIEVERRLGPWESPAQLLMFCVHGHLRRLQRRGAVRPVNPVVSPRMFVRTT